MVIISDTTPILSLLKCNKLILLKQLYEYVLVPEAVYKELTINSFFENERKQIIECNFIKMEKVNNHESVRILRNVTGLDAGESEALILYEEQKADLLLIDEHKGRGVAKKLSVEYIGTMGMFMMAYDSGFMTSLEVSDCITTLLDNDIRLSRNLCNKVLRYVGID